MIWRIDSDARRRWLDPWQARKIFAKHALRGGDGDFTWFLVVEFLLTSDRLPQRSSRCHSFMPLQIASSRVADPIGPDAGQ
jgi:hypothetical protein